MKPSDSSNSKNDDSIYSFAPSSADGRSRTRYRTVRCPICQTSVAVRDVDLGKTLVCPDCDIKINVPNNLPYNETQYEKRHYNEERLRQDKLLSPLRNPNRIGVDVDAANVYRIGKAENGTPDPEATRRSFQYRIVECPLCNTGVAVTRAELGRTLVCSDCGTKFKVPTNLDFSQTEHERNRFDVEKLRRDELLSPLRNPNREGIDVDSTTYALDVDSSFVEEARKKNRPTSAIYLTDAERAAQEETRQKAERTDSAQSEFQKNPAKTNGASNETTARKSGERSVGETDSDWIPVRCRVCETLTYAPRQNLGKTFRCADCGTESVVSLAFQDLQDAAAVRFAPRDRGTYRLDEKKSDASDDLKPNGSVAPAETFRLREAFETARRQKKASGSTQRADERARNAVENSRRRQAESRKNANSNVAENEKQSEIRRDSKKEKRAKKENIKKIAKLERIEKEKRAARTNRFDRENDTPPRVLRRRDGEWIWMRPAPPKRLPLFNGTFRPIFANDLWGRDVITLGAACVVAFFALKIIAEASVTNDGEAFGLVFNSALTGFELLFWIVLGVAASSFVALRGASSFACCFEVGNVGSRRIASDDGSNLAENLLYFLWILTILIAATATGALLLGGANALFERFGAVDGEAAIAETARAGERLREISIFVASLWFFFPIFFLSTLQADAFLCPLTADVARTLILKCGIWAQFYLTSAVIFAFPVALFYVYWDVKTVWFFFPVAAVAIPELYGLLFGRLSWILESAIQDAEFDD